MFGLQRIVNNVYLTFDGVLFTLIFDGGDSIHPPFTCENNRKSKILLEKKNLHDKI